MRAVWWFAGVAFAFEFLGVDELAAGWIEPAYIVGVPFDRDFYRSGLIHIENVLDAIERQSASAIDIEVGLTGVEVGEFDTVVVEVKD